MDGDWSREGLRPWSGAPWGERAARKELGHLCLGARISAACGRWNDWPNYAPLSESARQPPPRQGKGIFSCPLALGSAVQLVLANGPDA